MNYGYDFYFKYNDNLLTFPITPGELNITVGSKNKVVTLIDEGDINVLKSPSLTEIEFKARFPMHQYPFARTTLPFDSYWKVFRDLKENKKPFRFIVARNNRKLSSNWDTNILVALEKMELEENSDNGNDVIIAFKLKQYKEYGIKILPNATDKPTTSTAEENRPTDGNSPAEKTEATEEAVEYVVKSGDCLWNIAKAKLGDGTKWKLIYEKNKDAIEADAKKHGKASSSNGHWIWAGLKLIIPKDK